MIVKACSGLGWRFIDRVEDVEVEELKKDALEKETYPCQHYYCDENIMWIKKIRIIRSETLGFTLGDNVLFIKTDQAVYLLNDEGKTIEKIN